MDGCLTALCATCCLPSRPAAVPHQDPLAVHARRGELGTLTAALLPALCSACAAPAAHPWCALLLLQVRHGDSVFLCNTEQGSVLQLEYPTMRQVRVPEMSFWGPIHNRRAFLGRYGVHASALALVLFCCLPLRALLLHLCCCVARCGACNCSPRSSTSTRWRCWLRTRYGRCCTTWARCEAGESFDLLP